MDMFIEGFGHVTVPFKIGDIVRIKKGRYCEIYYWSYVQMLPKLLEVCPYQYGEGRSSFYVDTHGCVKSHVPKEWKIKHVFCNDIGIISVFLIVVLVSRFKDTLAISYNISNMYGKWEAHNPPFEVIRKGREEVKIIKVEKI